MRKRILCQFVTLFLLGMSYFVYHHLMCVVGAGLFVVYLLWHMPNIWQPGKGRVVIVLFMIGSLMLGVWRGWSYQKQRDDMDALLTSNATISFQGELFKKESQSDKTIYYLQDVTLQGEGQTVLCPSVILYPDSDCDSIGTFFVGKAKIKQFQKSRNEGNFDQEKFYRSNGVFAQLVDVTIQDRIVSTRDYRQWLYELRQKIGWVYEEYLPGEEAHIMSAITIGDKAQMAMEVKDLFRLSGISHIMAISGVHVSVVGMFLYGLLRKCGIGFVGAGCISFVVVFFYGTMSGLGNSALRAIIMYGIMLLANMLGRAYDSLTALSVAAFVMTWAQPLLLQNTGFLLSFGAVIGVVTIGTKIPTVLGVQLFLLPLMAVFYYEVPLYSVLLNIILLPFMGILLGAGLLGGLLGVAYPFFARVCLGLCHLIIYGYEWLADASLHLPGTRQIVGCPKFWQVMLFYGLLFIACYCLDKWKRLVCIVVAVVVLCLSRPTQFEMSVLDVGQGDAIFMQSEEGVTFFVDGGSTNVSQVGKYRILPFLKYRGVKAIDYWFVSHVDEDHISGLMECIQQEYPIKRLVFSSHVVKNENFEKLREEAAKHRIPISYMSDGMQCKTKSMTITCVEPNYGAVGTGEWLQDANAMSMALLVETEGFRGLLTGDLPMEMERLLPLQKIGKVDMYKASHHGSDTSSDIRMMQTIQPEVTVISCALKNAYGHPGENALYRIRKVGSEIYYTMHGGQIKITQNGMIKSFVNFP